jgi:hydroxymethylpyrimidine/phosphomethylpyrimidine kinase
VNKPPRVLAIAGSDSSGGAGIQADIKTITMLGGYAMTAITAVTAQNTLGVQRIEPLSVEIIEEQIASCVEDIGVDAIKIGMLGTEAAVRIVAGMLVALPEVAARTPVGFRRRNPPPELARLPIVLDPVMVSTSNALLADRATISAMRKRLFPIATVLTPNIPELEVLAEMSVRTLDDVREGALRLARQYGFHVLAKGGHSQHETVIDLLVAPDGLTLKCELARIDSIHTHGTGCTLSAAMATFLGAGLDLNLAFERAKHFVHSAIVSAPGYGLGKGPLGHAQVSRS